jgi:hypothetical protein
MRKNRRALQACGEFNLEKYVEVFKSLKKELDAVDEKYDEETVYGTIKSEQEQWYLKIREGLSELSEYVKE